MRNCSESPLDVRANMGIKSVKELLRFTQKYVMLKIDVSTFSKYKLASMSIF